MSDMSQRNALPPAADHEQHDALLVAQLAAGDALKPAEHAEAERLVRSCGACAALAVDLRVVAAAVAQEPVPPRRRDFRLSPEQAEELSGSVLTRFLRRFSLPSARAFQPAAAGVLSIGLLFVVAGYAWPDGGTITVQAEPNLATYGSPAPAAVADDASGARVAEPEVESATPPPESDLDALASSEELGAAEPDAEFFETLPESQAGTADRLDQKSMASGAEAPEAADEAAVAAGDAATRAADAAAPAAPAGSSAQEDPLASDAPEGATAPDVAAPEAPAALPAEESVSTSETLGTAAANDAAAEEPSVGQELGAVATELEMTTDSTAAGAVAADAVQTPTDEDGLEDLLVVLGVLLVLTGGGLLTLGWLARRTRDPLAP